MTRMTRQMFVAVAFAATVAAAVTGATLRGETREAATQAEICAKADWPMIPAACLDGAAERHVRIVTGEPASTVKFAAVDMSDRFDIAFQ
jgi:hypothetical protein